MAKIVNSGDTVYWVANRQEFYDVFYQCADDPRWQYFVARFFSYEEAQEYVDRMCDMEEQGCWFSAHANAAPPAEARANVFALKAHMTDWDAATDARLTEMWQQNADKEKIAAELGRTRQAIERRANYLGLPRRNKALAAFDARRNWT